MTENADRELMFGIAMVAVAGLLGLALGSWLAGLCGYV